MPHERRWRAAGAPLVLVTRAGVVLDVNEAVAALTGASREALCGGSLAVLCPALVERLPHLAPDGEVRTRATVVGAGGERLVVGAVLRALTPEVVQVTLEALQAADDGARDQARVLEAVRRLAARLHHAHDESEVVARATEALAAVAGPDRVAYQEETLDSVPGAGLRGGRDLAVVPAEDGGVEVVLPVPHGEGVLGVFTLHYAAHPALPVTRVEALHAVAGVTGLALVKACHHAEREEERAGRARAREALRQSRARYKAITEAIPDLIFRINRAGRYSFVAAKDEGLLALPPEELLGITLEEAMGPGPGGAWRKAVATALEAGRLQQLQYALTTQDGDEHVFEGRVVPIPEEDEVQVIVRDITERVRYEETLVEAKVRAEEMVALKASFLANMSHEIRTPLTAILGLADVLAPELSGEPRELLDLVSASAKRLMSTLNSVLDLAQFESGHLVLRPVGTDLAVLVRETTATFSREAAARGVTLVCEAPPAPVEAVLDASAVARVLVNLVSNAVKFTDKGEVRVTLVVGDGVAHLVVADTGIGIGPAFLPHVFDQFRQESEGISRTHQGAGLGLTITRHLVERMGGEIGVHSARGVGTTFRVRLPLGGAEEA